MYSSETSLDVSAGQEVGKVSRSKTEPVRYVILFQARSGSTFLSEALATHPDILALKEEFSRLRKQIRKGRAARGQQVRWLKQFWGDPPAWCNAIGFKTKVGDIKNPAAFCEIARAHNAKVIQLLRRNLVKVVVSLMTGERLKEETGNWNRYAEEAGSHPIEIDPVTFREWLEGVEQGQERIREFVKELGLDTLELWYEDLLVDRDGAFREVLDFIGLDHHPLESVTRKNTHDDLRRAVLNFDAVRAEYVDTRFRPMFDEVLEG